MGNSMPVMTHDLAQACEKFGLSDVLLAKLCVCVRQNRSWGTDGGRQEALEPLQ